MIFIAWTTLARILRIFPPNDDVDAEKETVHFFRKFGSNVKTSENNASVWRSTFGEGWKRQKKRKHWNLGTSSKSALIHETADIGGSEWWIGLESMKSVWWIAFTVFSIIRSILNDSLKNNWTLVQKKSRKKVLSLKRSSNHKGVSYCYQAGRNCGWIGAVSSRATLLALIYSLLENRLGLFVSRWMEENGSTKHSKLVWGTPNASYSIVYEALTEPLQANGLQFEDKSKRNEWDPQDALSE